MEANKTVCVTERGCERLRGLMAQVITGPVKCAYWAEPGYRTVGRNLGCRGRGDGWMWGHMRFNAWGDK